MMNAPETYLGDGVYVGNDGDQMWLALEAGKNPIALEPKVLKALITYAETIGILPSATAEVNAAYARGVIDGEKNVVALYSALLGKVTA